jgi:hypothetical protein
MFVIISPFLFFLAFPKALHNPIELQLANLDYCTRTVDLGDDSADTVIVQLPSAVSQLVPASVPILGKFFVFCQTLFAIK